MKISNHEARRKRGLSPVLPNHPAPRQETLGRAHVGRGVAAPTGATQQPPPLQTLAVESSASQAIPDHQYEIALILLR